PTSLVRVEFWDNGSYRIATVARLPRPDVAAAYPAYGPNHGFWYEVALPDGNHQLCAKVTNLLAGSDAQIGCKSISVQNNPVGTANPATVLDNTATITGSVADANTTDPLLVRAYTERGYVGAAWTDASHAFTLSITLAEGSHNVCLYVHNVGAGANSALGCQTVVVHNNPFGKLDSVGQLPTGLRVNGWAIDLNTGTDGTGTGPVLVRAYVDGRHAADTWANLARPDIGALYPASGPNHGYSFTLQVAQGSHSICTYASNFGAGVFAQLGCQTVTVQNNPVGAVENAIQVPGGIQISGYALDFNSTAPIGVHVYLDGRFAAGAYTSIARPDLATRYPGVAYNIGYQLTLPTHAGSHVVCAYALNAGPGSSTLLRCVRVTMQDNPVGKVESAEQYPGGVTVGGWVLDPDVTGPVSVRVYADGHWVAGGVANQPRTDLAALYPYNGTNHGFSIFTPLTPGNHVLCAYGMNIGDGTRNTKFGCVNVVRAVNPYGASTAIYRSGTSNTIRLSGWAIDPDTLTGVPVHVLVDGVDRTTLTANVAWPGTLARFPLYGGSHAYSGSIDLDAGEHTVCVTAYGVGPGSNLSLGCALIPTSGEAAPAMPTELTSWPGSRQVTLSWTAPRSDNAPITGYYITVYPGGRSAPVSGAVTSVVATGLTNGVHYTFVLRAINSLGVGSAASVAGLPTNIPPQITPAPVSTSHYIRNITGNLTTDAALMRSMGANDAAHNPSGHNYLILLQIGGQDEADQGVLLSATARYVTYTAVVNAMKAYLDGYATRQQPYAPLTLAVGTNNDVDVSASAGITWARTIVSPIAGYAAARHPGIVVAGANDMEPGFSASVGATRSWLSGYLSATSAPFVFNGSADGCSTARAGAVCNNGWTMSDLQWLSGGAAPNRTISLPQIYNYAMPLQWKYISLTGTNAGRSRINFGGPLTEYTACVQAGSCGSISNVDAWNRLWAAISSTPATRQPQLPNGTDLRIN
ncbi:MAG TPA: fibronectin type III domain-containing protein, partial [Jatrophihabitans sp.]|nr:fibronectin type III domain-containing protein [Jatrophihabitans sp.]